MAFHTALFSDQGTHFVAKKKKKGLTKQGYAHRIHQYHHLVHNLEEACLNDRWAH